MVARPNRRIGRDEGARYARGSNLAGSCFFRGPAPYTSQVNKAYEHLRGRGVAAPGVAHKEWGTELFEIVDSEGNVIKICNEP